MIEKPSDWVMLLAIIIVGSCVFVFVGNWISKVAGQ